MSKWEEKRLEDMCVFAARGITPQYVELTAMKKLI